MPPKIVSKDATYVSPLQQLQNKSTTKRVRVSRACDTCRRRKVKCDGKHPCIHCTVYSYECTYNHFRPAGTIKKPKKSNEEQIKKLRSGGSTNSSSAGHFKPILAEQLVKSMFPELDIDETFKFDLFIKIFEKHKNGGSIIDLNAILQEYNHVESFSTYRPIIDSVEIRIILPPREIALKLIYKTWNDSCVLFRFYHRPSFIEDFNSLYETDPTEYSNHQNKVLPLIYSVIAVGALFSKGDNAIDNQYLQDEGYKYFIASRKLIDITNSTDIQAIQTIFMLTLFLQCSARLSTCYSYIGIALRSALRQGLHRRLKNHDCDFIDYEIRKRLFWTIYKLEIYVNSMLGLPNSIDESDIDVEFPQDIDDLNLQKDKILSQKPGKLSSCGINNCHTKLILILNHIIKNLYKSSNPIYVIPAETTKNLENELKIWLYELPIQLEPNNQDVSQEYLKANKLLHLDFLHVQIMLYRPFIHYLKIAKKEPVDETGFVDAKKAFQYEKGIKCIEISKQIIILAKEMLNKKLLNGSYWFSVYTIFFAVACLVYYFLEIDSKDGDVNNKIELGNQLLRHLKQRSVSACRIYNLLNQMFENYDKQSMKLQVLEEKASNDANLHMNSVKPNLDDGNSRGANTDGVIASQASSSNDYVPGMMDQLDLQIFSRFLPSYMLQSQNGPGTNGDEMPSDSSRDLSLDNYGFESLMGFGAEQDGSSANSVNSGGSYSNENEDEEGGFDWYKFLTKNENYML